MTAGIARESPRRAARDGWPVPAVVLIVAAAVSCVACPGPGAEAPDVSLSQERDPVRATSLAIDAARASVSAVVYKFDEPKLLRAVTESVSRGVRVRLLVDGEEAGRARSLAARARAAGADVRRWPAELGKLHAKFTVVDGERVLAGSFNWTRSAARNNVEVLIEFDDPVTAQRFAELFERLWSRAGEAAPDR
jgi:phosphatidylserine/phosphatidylglycerophosphate/cardiolipin synthase-like enzyme